MNGARRIENDITSRVRWSTACSSYLYPKDRVTTRGLIYPRSNKNLTPSPMPLCSKDEWLRYAVLFHAFNVQHSEPVHHVFYIPARDSAFDLPTWVLVRQYSNPATSVCPIDQYFLPCFILNHFRLYPGDYDRSKYPFFEFGLNDPIVQYSASPTFYLNVGHNDSCVAYTS